MTDLTLYPKEPFLHTPGFERSVVFTSSARESWGLFLDWFAANGKGKVLLPAYIGYTEREGSGVFDPVEDSGVPFSFYPVDAQLRVSLDSLSTMLEAGDIGVLLIVHWFGFPPVDMQLVRDLCESTGVLLVEDCAHVIGLPGGVSGSLGTYGDVSFYSIHKVLGGICGGALVWNNPRLGYEAASGRDTCPAEVLAAMLRADIPGISRHRQGLYRRYAEMLHGVTGVELLYPELGDYVPHSVAVKIESGLRERLYFAMQDAGMPVTALYYRLITEIHEREFPDSHGVSGSILNLPVHQGVDASMVSRIVETLCSNLLLLRK